ncbi:hypothetical protein [Bacillus sp. FJAT-27231]|uniref:hypothetical protein n=1 Tax=Bacillus sp. FJAT-27231 TaxID=1679168 RepID=UPI0006710AFD|nr:hypothetical protein [Bacillus sp. FJAT-27231]
MKIFGENKHFSPHTIRAYRSDDKTLLNFLMDHSLFFRDIGFSEVKAYNRFITDKYAVKSARRKLDFFRRLLDFGYKSHLSTWITNPGSKKGQYVIEETRQNEDLNRLPRRELSQVDA